MLIRVGYEISFLISQATAMNALLRVHPSRHSAIRKPERFEVEPQTDVHEFIDSNGNICNRLFLPPGRVTLRNNATLIDSGIPDQQHWNALQHDVQNLPDNALPYLLASRYCEVDSELNNIAGSLFNTTLGGWHRVQSICNFVFQHLKFDYQKARANRTALESF